MNHLTPLLIWPCNHCLQFTLLHQWVPPFKLQFFWSGRKWSVWNQPNEYFITHRLTVWIEILTFNDSVLLNGKATLQKVPYKIPNNTDKMQFSNVSFPSYSFFFLSSYSFLMHQWVDEGEWQIINWYELLQQITAIHYCMQILDEYSNSMNGHKHIKYMYQIYVHYLLVIYK